MRRECGYHIDRDLRGVAPGDTRHCFQRCAVSSNGPGSGTPQTDAFQVSSSHRDTGGHNLPSPTRPRPQRASVHPATGKLHRGPCPRPLSPTGRCARHVVRTELEARFSAVARNLFPTDPRPNVRIGDSGSRIPNKARYRSDSRATSSVTVSRHRLHTRSRHSGRSKRVLRLHRTVSMPRALLAPIKSRARLARWSLSIH